MNLLLKNGTLQRIAVGVFRAETRSYSSNGKTIIWPGGLFSAPSDVAVADAFDTTWILVGAGASALVLLGGMAVVVRKRRAQLEGVIQALFTEVSFRFNHPACSSATLVTRPQRAPSRHVSLHSCAVY